MEFKKILVTDKKELINYRESIFSLFQECFPSKLNKDLWNWAYIDNPFGDPIVSLYFEEEKLAGHYAVIPFNLKHRSQELKSTLSMTTMVGTNYRGLGIFTQQAEEVYQTALEMNYDIVFGFPNKNSAPGFKKRLKWQILDHYVASLSKDELTKIKNPSYDQEISVDINSEKLMSWRLAKPGCNYIKCGNTLLKDYNENLDILYHEYEFDLLEEGKCYNLLLSNNYSFHEKALFEYKFGYRFLRDNKELDIYGFKVDLIMSDVF